MFNEFAKATQNFQEIFLINYIEPVFLLLKYQYLFASMEIYFVKKWLKFVAILSYSISFSHSRK